MNKNQIKKIINNEVELLVFKKASEYNFFESILSNAASVFAFLFFLKRKKYDYCIVTSKRVIIIKRNKIIKNIEYRNDSKVRFNSMNDVIEFVDIKNNKREFEIRFLRLTYEEIQHLKKSLNNK